MFFKSWKQAGIDGDIELALRSMGRHDTSVFKNAEVKAAIRKASDYLLVMCPDGRRAPDYNFWLRSARDEVSSLCDLVYLRGLIG
jgi:hypothetical protein